MSTRIPFGTRPLGASAPACPSVKPTFGMTVAVPDDGKELTVTRRFLDALAGYEQPQTLPLWTPLPEAEINGRIQDIPTSGYRTDNVLKEIERQILEMMRSSLIRINLLEALPQQVKVFVEETPGQAETLRQTVQDLEAFQNLSPAQLLEKVKDLAERSGRVANTVGIFQNAMFQARIGGDYLSMQAVSISGRLRQASQKAERLYKELSSEYEFLRNWRASDAQRVISRQLLPLENKIDHLNNLPPEIQPQADTLLNQLRALGQADGNDFNEVLQEQTAQIGVLAEGIVGELRKHQNILPATIKAPRGLFFKKEIPNPEREGLNPSIQIFEEVAQAARQLQRLVQKETQALLKVNSILTIEELIADCHALIADVNSSVEKLNGNQAAIENSVQREIRGVFAFDSNSFWDTVKNLSRKCIDLAEKHPENWKKPETQARIQRLVDTLLALRPSEEKVAIVRDILEKNHIPDELTMAWVRALHNSSELEFKVSGLQLNGTA